MTGKEFVLPPPTPEVCVVNLGIRNDVIQREVGES